MTRIRLSPQERRDAILNAAVTLAKTEGYNRISREAIAAAAGVSPGLVTTYFNTMPQLRRDLMRYAVRHNIVEVIAQGILHRDAQALKIDPEKRKEILAAVAEQ